jgi:hypothetical protein
MTRTYFFIALFSILFLGCNNSGDCGTENIKLERPLHSVDIKLLDSVVLNYITYSDNKLVRKPTRGDTTTTSYHRMNISRTDSAIYYVYSLGHDVPKGSGPNKFEKVSLLFVDSSTLFSYEYNELTKTLKEWKADTHYR